MTPFAHVSGGYLIVELADKIYPGVGFNRPDSIISAVIGANIPDFDVFFVKKITDHRNTITHTPIFWIVLLSICFGVAEIIKNPFITLNLTSFSLGLFTHFLFDWFAARGENVGGIRLFYPWIKKHYGFKKLEKLPRDIKDHPTLKKYLPYYLKDKFLFFGEVLVILLGILIFTIRLPGYLHYFFK